MIDAILPPAVSAAEALADIPGATLFPAEEAALAGAAGQRRAEFATGRACARAALTAIGVPAAPILPGPCGEPRWPAGVSGSITHCAGYRGCAVGRSSAVAAVGIDAEPNLPLPRGLLDMVAMAAERAWLAECTRAAPGVCWDRLVFSAKESVYKAWFALTGRRLRFADSVIVGYPASDRLTACLLGPGERAGGARPLARLEGRWLAAAGLVMTTVTVPAGQ